MRTSFTAGYLKSDSNCLLLQKQSGDGCSCNAFKEMKTEMELLRNCQHNLKKLYL